MPCVSGGRGMTLEHPPLQGTLGALHCKANIDFPTGSWDSGNGGTCLQYAGQLVFIILRLSAEGQ